MSFAEETFEAFKAIALKQELLTEDQLKPEPFLWRLEHWSLDFIASNYRFPGQIYDHALVLQPAIRSVKYASSKNHASRGKEFNHRPVEISIVAWSSATSAIKFLTRNIWQKDFFALQVPEKVQRIVNQDPKAIEYQEVDDFEALDKAIPRVVSRMTRKIHEYLYRGVMEALLPATKKRRYQAHIWNRIHKNVLPELGQWLQQRLDAETREFKSFIDLEAKESVLALAKTSECKKIDLYNHVVSMPKKNRLREFRIGAVNVLRPIGWRFPDEDPFWQKIDRGQPILNIVGDALHVYPTTVSDFIRHGDILCKKFTLAKAKTYAPYAEHVDTASWPTSKSEAAYFQYMCEYARIYVKAFDVLPRKIMGDLAKELDRHDPDRWQKLFDQRLCRERKKAARAYERHYNMEEVEVAHHVQLEQFRIDTSSIKDMRADIAQRILTPLLLLEFKRQGFEVLELSTIKDLTQEVERRLWIRAAPSEQIAASSYWHSGKVKFAHRVANASFTTADTSWKSLIDKPHKSKIDDKAITIVALDSDKLLKEEAAEDAMHNCLKDMTINCLRDRHHIFSIREGNDPVADFTCVDFPSAGKPYVTFLRIEGPKRTPAKEWARRAADAFIKDVNEGRIKVDWKKVYDSKLFYQQKQVDITVGYDFRDPPQLKRVCEVYLSLWPRRISKTTAINPTALAKYLGIPHAVREYLNDRDNTLRIKDFRPVGKPKAPKAQLAIA